MSHIQKVWVLAQSAKLLAKPDSEQALLLLDEATTEARRIDVPDLNRPRAFMAIANALNLVAPRRRLHADAHSQRQEPHPEEAGRDCGFDIEGIFREAANKDFDRAIQLARGFREEAPRANATLAICRAVLNKDRIALLNAVSSGYRFDLQPGCTSTINQPVGSRHNTRT